MGCQGAALGKHAQRPHQQRLEHLKTSIAGSRQVVNMEPDDATWLNREQPVTQICSGVAAAHWQRPQHNRRAGW